MPVVFLILPHQLFASAALTFEGARPWLVEEFLFFRQYAFHRRKLAFHRATMRAEHTRLEALALDPVYVEAHEERSDIRVLLQHLAAEGVTEVRLYDPVDDWLERRLRRGAAAAGMGLRMLPTPALLGNAEDPWFGGRKRFFHHDFYIAQRKRYGVLLAGGAPLGGKWSFDEDNRKRFPAGAPVPAWSIPETEHHEEAAAYVARHFAGNPGSGRSTIVYPVTHAAAADWLARFLDERLEAFGAYEDAIVTREPLLHHSLLSPLMNCGLLTPHDVLDAVLAREGRLPLNSIEGFVRQVLGWREFVAGIYRVAGRQQRRSNFFGCTRLLPRSVYEGTTGIAPVDNVIRKVLEHGYCHHIERLMILGNFFLLCEFDPDEVYRWFMELFIDAYDWVMVPNVYGMSQFADGGLMCTKPYISGSNYVLKMSDHKKDPRWTEVWDGLFWRFIDRRRDFFGANPRLSMMVRTLDRMDARRRAGLLQRADEFLARLDAGITEATLFI
ncbi:cryptochrome/photolyase family protein [Flaviaesturariibacter amylovorans]|uniref:Cryptochrome/photolyase family protein n=1 Tax=Flaviaesturariibacter amylovorans TaxID=1084520 RepID=A0ABP8G6G8_9BACT